MLFLDCNRIYEHVIIPESLAGAALLLLLREWSRRFQT
jgi:hypothetical protein